MRPAKHILRSDFADPIARRDGCEDNDPQNQQRTPVAHLSSALLGACSDAADDLRGEPHPEQHLPKYGQRHRASNSEAIATRKDCARLSRFCGVTRMTPPRGLSISAMRKNEMERR